MPVTSSNQIHTRLRNRMPFLLGSLDNGGGTRQNLNLAFEDTYRILIQRFRRRPGSYAAVAIEDAAMAWAHEQVGIGQPADRAAEMRANHRECDKLLIVLAAKPGGCLGGHSGPR